MKDRLQFMGQYGNNGRYTFIISCILWALGQFFLEIAIAIAICSMIHFERANLLERTHFQIVHVWVIASSSDSVECFFGWVC